MRIIHVFIYLLIFPVCSWAQKASLSGKVVDATSNEPLPFVNVVVAGTGIGTVTDTEGHFVLKGLESGFIRVEASFVGYRKVISSETEVRQAGNAYIEIKMEKSRENIDEVTVKASPFRVTMESPLSMRTIGVGEIEKSPGANRDVSRIIQSFPGVQSTPAYRNDVIIRGGGPSESRFFLDDVEIPNINHFSTQGASGGPVGILNADFIREVNYYSGAFPANRGNALSGVLEFRQIDGNEEKMQFHGTLGASEVAATLDGPLGEKTNYVFSVRRSYLQLLFSALELPFLPNFTDMQFKVRTRFDQKNELTLIGLGAYDVNKLNLDIENPDEEQQYILSQLPENRQWSYTVGAVYKHYRDNSYQTFVVSRSQLKNLSDKYLDNDKSTVDNRILDYESQEVENKIRLENTSRIDGFKLNFGAGLDVVNYLNNTVSGRFYEGELQQVNYDADLSLLKYSLFFQLSKNVFDERLALSLGVRTDANNYSASMNNLLEQISPRFSASYKLSPQWSLNFNTGRYYQLPSYTSLGFKQDDVLVNKQNKLKYISVDHLIGGLEFRPKSTVQLSAEAFWKSYADYPFSVKDQISLANKGADYGVIGDEEVVSSSEGRAYGAEFQARINSSEGFNFNLSYTLVRSEFKNGSQQYIPSSWDSQHLLVLTTTKDLKKGWSLGARWRYVGALPYTPWDLDKSSLVEAWNLSGGPYYDFSRLNSERQPAFHQLDVRVDKAIYGEKITTKFYIDIQNLYNFQAKTNDIVVRATDASGNFLLTDNGTRYQLNVIENKSGTVLPTIGVIVSF
ncbi:TonB-dependent receptor [Maribellus sp. YY47]|uniref:TonB-dependent receptor n=1 Tax=Maribellus sp. YY47 TaxID=2929486 RepID=UPI002000BBBF|nr:TonB-dependent receptor [Maribellus sp. YY47]MCK3686090.1 TonB-dependent receptor [Maribellus sp. YY47]